jgi:hypothetical protein
MGTGTISRIALFAGIGGFCVLAGCGQRQETPGRAAPPAKSGKQPVLIGPPMLPAAAGTPARPAPGYRHESLERYFDEVIRNNTPEKTESEEPFPETD